MENKDAIIGQLMDQGYDFDSIIEALDKSTDTEEVIKKLELKGKKKESLQSEVRFLSQKPENNQRLIEEKKEEGDKEMIKKLEEESSEDGLGILIEFCKKKSRLIVPNSNFHKDFKSVVYTVEIYKDN